MNTEHIREKFEELAFITAAAVWDGEKYVPTNPDDPYSVNVAKSMQGAFESYKAGYLQAVKDMEPKASEVNHDALFFVGYTNGAQIYYGAEDEGSFYSTTDNDCYIPLYMLRTHEHRIEAGLVDVTLEKIQQAQNDNKSLPEPPK